MLVVNYLRQLKLNIRHTHIHYIVLFYFYSTLFLLFVPDNSLSRIAKGTRRATVVATATVVAAIKENGDSCLDSMKEDNDRLSSSLNTPSTRNKHCTDILKSNTGTTLPTNYFYLI